MPQQESSPATRAGRLGPFSGAQLTAIIITFAVLLLFPVGAWAVTGSNVFLTDAGSGQHATVGGAGQLMATRAGAKSFVSGQTIVDGGASDVVLLQPPSGKALIVTSVAGDIYQPVGTPGISFEYEFHVSHNGVNCAPPKTFVFQEHPTELGSTFVPFDPGIVVPAGRALCADVGNVHVILSAHGYLIPAAAAPTESP